MAATLTTAWYTTGIGKDEVENSILITEITNETRHDHAFYIWQKTQKGKIKIYVIPVLSDTPHFRIKKDARSDYVSGGGPMSNQHRNCENEMYYRSKEHILYVILSDQECPFKQFGCKRYVAGRCIARAPRSAINISDIYNLVILEPKHNLNSRRRSDIQLLNQTRTLESAIEVEHEHADEQGKKAMGVPTIVVKADLKWLKAHPVLDCRNGNRKCWAYNIWAYPFMIAQYPCGDIRNLFTKFSLKRINLTHESKHVQDNEDSSSTSHPHGMNSQSRWIEPNSAYEGEPFDYVYRKAPEHVLEIRTHRPYLCVLDLYTRSLYNLEATHLEECLDSCLDELDMIVDIGKYKGKTVGEIAKVDFTYVTEFLQKGCDNWRHRFSEDCIKYIKEMRGLGKVIL